MNENTREKLEQWARFYVSYYPEAELVLQRRLGTEWHEHEWDEIIDILLPYFGRWQAQDLEKARSWTEFVEEQEKARKEEWEAVYGGT